MSMSKPDVTTADGMPIEIATDSRKIDPTSSTSDEGSKEKEVSDVRKIDRSPSPLTNNVVLTHDDALDELLLKTIGPFSVVSDWNTDDLKGLLMQIMQNLGQCDLRTVEKIQKNFRGTSIEDIMKCIDDLRQLNHQADMKRFGLDKIPTSVTPTSTEDEANVVPRSKNKKNNDDWSKLFNRQIKRARKVPEMTAPVLSDILAKYCESSSTELANPVLISASPHVKSTDLKDNLYYELIYNNLSSMAYSRSLEKNTPLEAAVMMDIFDQLEQDVEKFPELIEYFAQMYKDIQNQTQNFNIGGPLDDSNVGAALTNTLGLPKDLLDMSKFLSKK